MMPRSITNTLKHPSYSLCWMNWSMINNEHCFQAPEYAARYPTAVLLLYCGCCWLPVFKASLKHTWTLVVSLGNSRTRCGFHWDLLSACRPFFKISYVSSNRLVVLTGLSGHFPSNLKEVLIEAFLSGTDELMSDMTWQLNNNNQGI